MKLGDITKYLPVGSLINKARNEQDSSIPKILGHYIYAVVPSVLLAMYVSNGMKTGSWSPSEQSRIKQEIRIEQEAQEKRYDELWDNIFADPLMYADMYGDQDGELSLKELADVYERAGHERPSEFSLEGLKTHLGTFPVVPKLELNDLERATESYEADIAKDSEHFHW